MRLHGFIQLYILQTYLGPFPHYEEQMVFSSYVCYNGGKWGEGQGRVTELVYPQGSADWGTLGAEGTDSRSAMTLQRKEAMKREQRVQEKVILPAALLCLNMEEKERWPLVNSIYRPS